MAIPIPYYLNDISKVHKEKKSSTVLDIVCTCGSETFGVYKNVLDTDYLSAKEAFRKQTGKWASKEKYTDKKGDKFIVTRNFFGIISGKIPEEEFHYFTQDRHIIKLCCNACKKEHILFDNSQHGFTGVFSPDNGQEIFEYELIKTKDIDATKAKISVEIYNDASFEIFKESADYDSEPSFKDFSNAYSSINIYVKGDNKAKPILVFSEETA